LLSVILPNFNHGAFIPRALSALLSQEPPPTEIIIIDDGSTDDSLTIIRQFADVSPTLRILVNAKNKGVIAAQKRGLEVARGRYIYFAAADDWVMPGFFALGIGTLDAHSQAGLFCGETMLIDGHTGRYIGIRPVARPRHSAGYIDQKSTGRLLMRTDNWIVTGSALFRSEAIQEAGGLDETLGSAADGYLSRKVALTTGFCFAPQIVSTWCIFSGGVSRTAALDLIGAQKLLQIVPDRIKVDPVFPTWYADVFRNRWRFATARLALDTPVNRPLLLSIGASSSIDRTAFKIFWATLTPRLGRLATLGWLWLRWRPTALSGVVWTAIARYVEWLYRSQYVTLRAFPNHSQNDSSRAEEAEAAYSPRHSDSAARNRNVDAPTVAGFGREWITFPQDVSVLSMEERTTIFDNYFDIFPWDSLPANCVGADVGCGSGRWALLAAPLVGHLHLIDASEDAISVAKTNLAELGNVSFHVASVADLPLADASLDFAYAVGVLHHVPDTERAIRSIARKLKPGAPFLIYLYYALENQPAWYRGVWRLSNALRIVLSRSPPAVRYAASQGIAAVVYWPLARTAALLDGIRPLPQWVPLSFYKDRSFYVMRTDAYDRFCTPLEKRFTKEQVRNMLEAAGFERVRFSNSAPFWCAVANRGSQREL
jgi:glycosyltransferase involved in cell wall biosynthesis/ubiquinone/menaquinone biosynthesis C-methylase UbiE